MKRLPGHLPPRVNGVDPSVRVHTVDDRQHAVIAQRDEADDWALGQFQDSRFRHSGGRGLGHPDIAVAEVCQSLARGGDRYRLHWAERRVLAADVDEPSSVVAGTDDHLSVVRDLNAGTLLASGVQVVYASGLAVPAQETRILGRDYDHRAGLVRRQRPRRCDRDLSNKMGARGE